MLAHLFLFWYCISSNNTFEVIHQFVDLKTSMDIIQAGFCFAWPEHPGCCFVETNIQGRKPRVAKAPHAFIVRRSACRCKHRCRIPYLSLYIYISLSLSIYIYIMDSDFWTSGAFRFCQPYIINWFQRCICFPRRFLFVVRSPSIISKNAGANSRDSLRSVNVCCRGSKNINRVENSDIQRAGHRWASKRSSLTFLYRNRCKQVSWTCLRTDIQRAGLRLARRPPDLAFRPPSCRRQPSWTSLRKHKHIKPTGNKTGFHGQDLVSCDFGAPLLPWWDWDSTAFSF